ncbi:MAG TPA: hypothetical protein VLA09_08945, partial [Longimicrobiales bacterium]|nr:hypothetical protein [Longimicrobiales bacterium]
MPRGFFSICCVLFVGSGSVARGPDPSPPGAAASHARPVGEHLSAPEPAAPLPFFYDLFTFRSESGGTDVVAAIAVHAGRLRRERTDDRVRYRFDVRFVLADTARRSVFRSIDSVFVSLPYSLPGQHLLHTYVQVRAPPSGTTLQRVIVTDASRPGVGQLYQSPLPVPDYGGDELMLSDVAFGLPDAEDGWTRRGVTLALLPTSQFPESAFDVYYEVYNLPPGTPYETEISIEPLDGGDDPGPVVRAVFRGESASDADGTLGELRRIESALAMGRYRLTVVVRDRVNGRLATRSRPIEVRGWGDGM